MPLLFIIGFFLWVWAELAALVAIGGEVGVLLTIAGIFVTAMVGMWLLRTQGRVIMSALQAQLVRGGTPVDSLADGVSVMGGAVLMLGLIRREPRGPGGIGFESVGLIGLYGLGVLTVVLV